METKDLDFGAAGASDEHLRVLLHRMSEFIALYEMAEGKIREREKKLSERLSDQERFMDSQLAKINHSLEEFSHLTTEMGVARWRVTAETALREGNNHLKNLQESTEVFRQLSQETCERLDRATAFTIKGVADAIGSFRAADFRQLTEDSCERVERSALTAVRNIARVARWFYWKKLLLVFSTSLLVAMVFGMYMNGEWPWETHKQILQQRSFGSAVLNTWSQLSPHDQQIILNYTQQQNGGV